ncbi:hypothetical protein [Luteolibacter sp. AS25]|uniref:hypothetical protein n=1 Tax=Luteolibacter sp. AS25 TaxID=3135776 RepID=UPI00398A8307
MTQSKRYLVLGLAILGFGAVRLPFEQGLAVELEEAKLMPPKLDVTTGDRIGQTFSAVSLGGLRTLVATFMNLRAFGFFTEQRWADVESAFETIVDLAPRTRYYWETGSWHQAYNASAFYLYGESELPALRRKLSWRESVLKGREFLKRGIRNNPEDPILHESLARLLSDSNKIAAFESVPDAYEEAYEQYMAALQTGKSRGYTKRAALYVLARVPGRESEALAMLEEMEREQHHLFPTQRGLFYTLSYHENPDQDVMSLVDSVFKDRRDAYDVLGNQWLRTRDHFPMFGVAKALKLLEKDLKVPDEKSIFKVHLQSPMSLDDEFR